MWNARGRYNGAVSVGIGGVGVAYRVEVALIALEGAMLAQNAVATGCLLIVEELGTRATDRLGLTTFLAPFKSAHILVSMFWACGAP